MAHTRFIRKSVITTFIILTLSFLLASCGEEHRHEWGEWEPYIESTCYVAGQERSVCSCGAAQYRRIELAHEFELQSADLAEKKETEVCVKCGTKEERDLTYGTVKIPIVTAETESTITLVCDGGEFSASFVKASEDSYKLTLKDGAAQVAKDAGAFSEYYLTPGYLKDRTSYGAIAEDLYGQVASTGNYQDPLSSAPNFGAGEGIPVAFYNGDKFSGIYTLSPAKDAFFSDSAAAMISNAATAQTELRAAVGASADEAGFKVIWKSDSLGDDALYQSFNDLISFIGENDWDDFRDGVSAHVAVDRAIDEMLFTCAIGATDSVSANILWLTYDGTTWIPVPCKLDGAFADAAIEPDHGCNLLWEKLNLYFGDEIGARWRDLRFGALSLDSIEQTVRAHFKLPSELTSLDGKTASDASAGEEATVASVMAAVNANLSRLDAYYGLQ